MVRRGEGRNTRRKKGRWIEKKVSEGVRSRLKCQGGESRKEREA